MDVQPLLTIGDFSRATHMSIKMLRHYHRIGLLEPADIDCATGYRRYTTDQIPAAQVIRRFRALDMPLEQIHAVLTASDVRTRNRLIGAHLDQLETGLARTQEAIDSLRDLLTPRAGANTIMARVGHRNVEATRVAAITEIIELQDGLAWFQGALGELKATTNAQHTTVGAPPGGIFSEELFTQHSGSATVFLPCSGPIRQVGRVNELTVPSAELATIVHVGPLADIDRAYGILATYVAAHAMVVDGPIHEHYLVGLLDTADQSQWRTEIGWPVFQTTTDTSPHP